MIYLLYKQCWLVSDDLLLLRNFGPYVITFMNVCVLLPLPRYWRSFAVKELWALWDNIITVAMVIPIRGAYNVHAAYHNATQLL
jgi:hypothetical protein